MGYSIMKQAAEVLSALAAALTNPIYEVLNMAKRILPTPEQLRELLTYEPETGKLFWKVRPESMFEGSSYPAERLAKTWNTKYASKQAFTAVKEGGYHVGRVFRDTLLSHRVAWAIHYGEWPTMGIDHINGKTSDNRIANLRLATQTENMRNTKIRSNNGSGVKGVFWSKKQEQWCAQIAIHGKSRHLGFYDRIEDAGKAYRDAATQLHGAFANFG